MTDKQTIKKFTPAHERLFKFDNTGKVIGINELEFQDTRQTEMIKKNINSKFLPYLETNIKYANEDFEKKSRIEKAILSILGKNPSNTEAYQKTFENIKNIQL